MRREAEASLAQIGVVVEDAAAAARAAEARYRIGGFTFTTWERPVLRRSHYRGAPSDFSMVTAIAPLGDFELEFISPIGGPSMYSDHLRAEGSGAHHLLVVPVDPEAAAAAANSAGASPGMGSAIAIDGTSQEASFVYLDSKRLLGIDVELLSVPERIDVEVRDSPPLDDPTLLRVTRIGIYVSDAGSAARAWSGILGIDGWSAAESDRARIIAADVGGIKLELFEPIHSELYGELAGAAPGLRYVGVVAALPAEQLAAVSGDPILGREDGETFLDSRATLGFALVL